jgi:hypothetical protein
VPALPAVPGLAKISLKGHQGSAQWAMVFHVMRDDASSWTQADLDGMCDLFRTSFISRFGTSLSSVGGIDTVDGVDLSSDLGVVSHRTTAAAFTGAATSTSPNVAFVLHWNIARRYRGGHPRTYLPCVAEADVDESGNVSAGRYGTITAAAGNWINDISTHAMGAVHAQLFCIHYVRDGAVLGFPLLDIILGGTCRTIVGTQRRRLPRIV